MPINDILREQGNLDEIEQQAEEEVGSGNEETILGVVDKDAPGGYLAGLLNFQKSDLMFIMSAAQVILLILIYIKLGGLSIVAEAASGVGETAGEVV